jgi:hypothetical protein
MTRTPNLSVQLLASALLSVLLSVAVSRLLQIVLSATSGPAKEVPGSDGPPRPRGANISPTAVFIIMPILVKNSFGPHKIINGGRYFRRLGGRRRK